MVRISAPKYVLCKETNNHVATVMFLFLTLYFIYNFFDYLQNTQKVLKVKVFILPENEKLLCNFNSDVNM